MTDRAGTLTLSPIGVIRTPFAERVGAPRQTYVAPDVEGTIVLAPGRDFEHAMCDLDGWEYLWVLYWFHLNEGWRPKVLPPRSKVRRGVFSTRSPHRPSPIGMSVVKLVRVDGLSIHVRGVDMIDGTPVLDIKPYVPAADAFPEARSGWLTSPDPLPPFAVTWSELAREQTAFLLSTYEIDLMTPIERVLVLGPEPHPYRRIRKDARGSELAVKEWRVRFVAAEGERRVTVTAVGSGYREAQLRPVEEGGDARARSPPGAGEEVAALRLTRSPAGANASVRHPATPPLPRRTRCATRCGP